MGKWDIPARREITDTELRFNPYHDPQNGRFTTAGGGGGGGYLYSKGGKSAYVFEKNSGQDFDDAEYEKWASTKVKNKQASSKGRKHKMLNEDMKDHTTSAEFNKLLYETPAKNFSDKNALPEHIEMYGHKWEKIYSYSGSSYGYKAGKKMDYDYTTVLYQSSKSAKDNTYPIVSIGTYKNSKSKSEWKYDKAETKIM